MWSDHTLQRDRPDLHTALHGAAKDVVSDPDVLESYRRDQAAPGMLEAGHPAAVVRPRTTAEVQAVVRVAAQHCAPVVPRGAGSGLSGGANAVDGCVVVSTERMTTVREIDEASMTAVVEAGVINDELRRAAAKQGLWYAPDPASMEFSTIGGNVATNAGGLCCVKYGVTRDALLGLELVLADGSAVRLGHRTRKGVAGYDLAGLMCGSEGTLGIITEVTVRLLPLPRPSVTLVASFPSLDDAGEAASAIARRVQPSLLELMDRTTVCAVDDFKPMDLDREVGALLFARSDAGALQGPDDVARMERWCEELGATLVVTSDEEAEGRMLMAARRLALPALEQLGTPLLDDVAVPVPRIPSLLRATERIAHEHEVLIATFGHVGDGNMHPTIVYDHHDAAATAQARSAFDAVLDAALELGGTITGEHGVGVLKRDALPGELDTALSVHRRIKTALDPDGIMNPGKVLHDVPES